MKHSVRSNLLCLMKRKTVPASISFYETRSQESCKKQRLCHSSHCSGRVPFLKPYLQAQGGRSRKWKGSIGQIISSESDILTGVLCVAQGCFRQSRPYGAVVQILVLWSRIFILRRSTRRDTKKTAAATMMMEAPEVRLK